MTQYCVYKQKIYVSIVQIKSPSKKFSFLILITELNIFTAILKSSKFSTGFDAILLLRYTRPLSFECFFREVVGEIKIYYMKWWN